MEFIVLTIESTASTNDDVKQAALLGGPEGLVIRAETQRAGRGRRGRVWESPEGNLYASVLLRPPFPPRDYGKVSFAAVLAVGEALDSYLPPQAIRLKWPNDVLVDGKKISGILLESIEGGLVVGIGINILRKPEHAQYPATCLADRGTVAISDQTIPAVLNSFLSALDHWYGLLITEGFEPLRTAWIARAQKGTLRVRIKDADIEGVFLDLDSDGSLYLRSPEGTEHRIIAGAGDVLANEQGFSSA